MAAGTSTVGTQYGPALAPMGPTIVSLALDIAFFEGT
jgi:hypothetical protein